MLVRVCMFVRMYLGFRMCSSVCVPFFGECGCVVSGVGVSVYS